MDILQKNINGKMRRFVVTNNNKYSNFYYILDQIRKKCIYFDYLVVYNRRNYGVEPYFTIYTKNLSILDLEKFKPSWGHSGPEMYICNYESDPNFLKTQRYNKLKRLLVYEYEQ